MKQLSWKAVRRGAIYCAPACGAKCTWEKYQHAKRAGRELAERLGPGWKAHVWENMGWHWKALGPGGAMVYDQGRPGAPRYWCSERVLEAGNLLARAGLVEGTVLGG